MPHILLETSADVLENDRIPELLDALVAVLAAQDSVESSAIKARHGMRANWSMGAGAPAGFVHCEVRLITGRSPALRESIADAMFACLEELLHESLGRGEISLTLELREMQRETYRKAPRSQT